MWGPNNPATHPFHQLLGLHWVGDVVGLACTVEPVRDLSLADTYLMQVAAREACPRASVILATHLLPDRPALIAALDVIAQVRAVVAIPYSSDEAAVAAVASQVPVIRPSLEELLDPLYMVDLVRRLTPANGELVLGDMGGYFATPLDAVVTMLDGRCAGVVEDTESGHRRYEAADLSVPALSLARSPLKEPEDILIGSSCLYSVERMLRSLGSVLESRHATVLGYGRIGRSVAASLRARHCPTTVFDTDPIRRIAALAEGFPVPDRRAALSHADLIFGASGSASLTRADVPDIRPGAVLVSCSSKRAEFDLGVPDARQETGVLGLAELEIAGHILYLAADGEPVNFLDGAEVGPLLYTTQAELICAVAALARHDAPVGLSELPASTRNQLASDWIEVFCDPSTGTYLPLRLQRPGHDDR